jgi:exosome complex exonuclease RRP6
MSRANIEKPQLKFEKPPDNLNPNPWKPILTRKPFATVPLEASLGSYIDENQNTQYDYSFYIPLAATKASVEFKALSDADKEIRIKNRLAQLQRLGDTYTSNHEFRYKHPYEAEILQLQYPSFVYEKREPIQFLPIESTTATWVDTFEGVEIMLEELKTADEIAIDLEHHDYRTYTGLLSLMQISTRDKDWIVDTLQPWRHRLEVLNEVFTDPTKLKVGLGKPVASVLFLIVAGSARSIYGYDLASKGPWPLRCWAV